MLGYVSVDVIDFKRYLTYSPVTNSCTFMHIDHLLE
jgi:hypothetical protein